MPGWNVLHKHNVILKLALTAVLGIFAAYKKAIYYAQNEYLW